MTRFNYASSRFERTIGGALPPHCALDRASLAALCAALLFVASIVAAQLLRLHAIESDAAALSARRAALQGPLNGLHATESDVRRMMALLAADRAVRRSGTVRANEVAAIGNALPPDAWLTGMRLEPASIAIEGRGARMRAIAETLDALTRVHGVTAARLVSARRDAMRSDVIYAIALERRP